MMKNSFRIAALIAVLATLWIVSGVIAPANQVPVTGGSAEVDGKARIKVRVRTTKAEEVAGQVVITGRTQASRNVELRAETAAQVEDVSIEEGTFAEKGTVLLRLETRDRAVRVAEAKEKLAQKQIEFNAAQSLETKGYNSRIRLAQARAELETARAELEAAQIDLAKTEIKAPFSGIVYNQQAEIGDYIAVGQPVFSLAALDPLEITGFLTEQQVVDIEPDTEVQAQTLSGDSVTGKVSYLAPVAQEDTRTFPMKITVPNPDLSLIEGMTVEVKIPTRIHKAHKISPSVLSLNDQGVIGVKIVDDNNVVQFCPVTIISDTSAYMLVTGLPETARIITVGQEFVISGQEVEPVAASGDGLL